MAAGDLVDVAATPDLVALADSWALTLEAENKAARTVAIYTESVHRGERRADDDVGHVSVMATRLADDAHRRLPAEDLGGRWWDTAA